MVPSARAERDCLSVLADTSATPDEHAAARSVIKAAQAQVPASLAAVSVLGGYIRRQQEQDRWGH